MWPWIAGIASVLTMALMATKWRWAPVIGLGFQSTWYLYVFIDEVYGLLTCTFAYTVILIIASFTWRKKS